jgi:hypothetical protein
MIKSKKAVVLTQDVITWIVVLTVAVILLIYVVYKFLPWSCDVFNGAFFYCK